MAFAIAFFAKPDGDLLPLGVPPRLTSWMRAGHADQLRLEAFLSEAERMARPRWEAVDGPLALCLDVGLAPTVDLLKHHDLDNYLFPLVFRLSRSSGREFVSVRASKLHGNTSTLRVDRAVTAHAEVAAPGQWLTIRTTASSESVAYKEQIEEQLADQDLLPDGAVSLQLSFTVGPRRNWLNLWKPTIDALGRLLGRSDPGRPWHVDDGRVVELGMHCKVDAALGNDVVIAIAASSVDKAADLPRTRHSRGPT